jgi:molybdopterin-containing oxidoreductase family iron-sulfur binding subunit
MTREHDKHWRSLEELHDEAGFREAAREAFGGIAARREFSRRQFLGLMGASMGLAGLTACRRPEEKILPYSRAPEGITPGSPDRYATAFPWGPTAIGLLVECHEGRPTKIEGNPAHSESLGGTTAFAQASILDLYDPDRSTAPSEKGQPRTWDDAAAFLKARGQLHREKAGKGLAILTEAHRSPTLAAVLAKLSRQMPQALVFRYEPFDRDRIHEGGRIAFGTAIEPVLHLDRAEVIVALDEDFLGWEGSPVRQAHEFASRRRLEQQGDRLNRLYVIESTYTITGACADHRLRLPRRDIPAFAMALAKELAAKGLELGEIAAAVQGAAVDAKARKWAVAVAKDLLAHHGESLVTVGSSQPPAVHALIHAVNAALRSHGTTLELFPAFSDAPEGASSLASLAGRMMAGEVETLLVFGGNPALTGPAAFTGSLAKVGASIHLSTHLDETSAQTSWHLNRAHYLEGWSDVVAQDGTASILQPLIAPLFGGRTDAEVVQLLLGSPRKAYDLVRDHWSEVNPGEPAWRNALHDGTWSGSGFAALTAGRRIYEPAHPGAPVKTDTPPALPVDAARVAQAIKGLSPAPSGLEVTFHPDPHAFDGRFANNGWMQELPDPMARLTWGNAAMVSPATAARLGLAEGDLIELKVSGVSILPVCLAPGQADDSIAVTVGQGRRAAGKVGNGVGHDAFPLRVAGPFDAVHGVSLKKLGQTEQLARTQQHALMEGRPLVREADLKRFEEEPDFAPKMVRSPPLKSLFADFPYPGQRWAMVIDLNACVGCGACALGCQAENNVPLVGKDGVLRSREMHWLRVDRYFQGMSGDPQAVFQPVACHHCENAPCEQVCPVGATTHSPEGLNDMAYNRCIGTRYCANNCPFKVRRFNFFNYTKDTPELHKMQKNPNVTVRARGVMEKCTYCVQRIQTAKIAAHKAGQDKVVDGVIQTACQQACPAKAIRFGDLADPQSEVARARSLPRAYAMLAELNIRPRTSFLARVRNPNPDLEKA